MIEHGHGETVVLVEDRDDVAALGREILEDFGYRVVTAANARQALDMLDQTDRIDLLFSDLIIPGGMNGVVLAREAVQRRPNLKVLLTTGYAETSLERSDLAKAEFDVIDKPYRRMDLARKIRAILDR